MLNKLLNSLDVKIAKTYYDVGGDKRDYHNFDHILENHDIITRLYSNGNEYYDYDLFLANLWHDAVYDEKPFKEKRSADAFYRIYSDPNMEEYVQRSHIDIDKVHRIIMSTSDHIYNCDESFHMVQADLYAFTDINKIHENRRKLYFEAEALYTDMSVTDYLENTVNFLEGLHQRITKEQHGITGLALPEDIGINMKEEIDFLGNITAKEFIDVIVHEDD